MRWEIAIAVAAVVLFFALRFTARGWIANAWIDGRLSDLQTGVLLGLIYLAPILLLVASAVMGMPESIDSTFLAVAVLGVPLVALVGGLVDYATLRGVKQMLRQRREGQLSEAEPSARHGR